MKYQIRAQHTAPTIHVYQAYSPTIAQPALEAGRFVPPFKMGRMTWIKPSFNWMIALRWFSVRGSLRLPAAH